MRRLVLRAQCNDREALEALLRSVQPSLRRYLAGLAGPTDADDLLQDVLVIVIRKLGMLDDPKLFRPWSFRIASREAFRHIRKRSLWHERHEDDAELDDLVRQKRGRPASCCESCWQSTQSPRPVARC
jgi:RNA polymerase sigma factor (sigma-70 family)